jgi:dTDP-4-dehydrorhamnose reductase
LGEAFAGSEYELGGFDRCLTGISLAGLEQDLAGILLTGGSGFLAWSFLAQGEGGEFILPLRQENSRLKERAQVFCVDLENEVQVRKFWDECQPSAVINTAACADPQLCQLSPDQTQKINENLPRILAQCASEAKVPMAHFSTDLVFNGRGAPYGESDKPCPLSAYGQQKSSSEQLVLNAYPEAWVLRLPLLFGESGSWSRNGMADQWQQLQQGQSLNLFTDEFRTPARCKRIARFVLDQLGRQTGLMHLGGPERLSRYDMGKTLCEVFGAELSLLNPKKQADLNLGTERPADVSLNSDRARSYGYACLSFAEELKDIKANGFWRKET